MDNRFSNHRKSIGLLHASGLTDEQINSVITLFDKLQLNYRQTTVKDVEDLIEGLANFSDKIEYNLIHFFTKAISAIAKQYTALFPVFIHAFELSKQDQIKFAGIESLKAPLENAAKFTFYLKEVLIKPMLFRIAHTTEHSYTSKYVGKIPIVTTNKINDKLYSWEPNH
jgi:hypothetical protein